MGSHLDRIAIKLGARTQSQAVATAVELGLLAPAVSHDLKGAPS